MKIDGRRASKVLATKAAAQAWGAQTELDASNAVAGLLPNRTVGEALAKYGDEVSEHKRGARWELLRLAAFARDYPHLAALRMASLSTADAAAWRDSRLKTCTQGTVRREMNLLRHVWAVAAREWGWVKENPWSVIKSPADSPPRTRRVHWTEVRRICRNCGYVTGQTPKTKLAEVALAFLISLRTGMRAGEVLQLKPGTGAAVVYLERTKTEEGRVPVPLTPAGVRLMRQVPVWTLKSSTLDALFRKVTARLLIDDLHFHDARAEALTLLSRRVDVLTLARISRHKDLRILQQRYYRETAEEIAGRLARR